MVALGRLFVQHHIPLIDQYHPFPVVFGCEPPLASYGDKKTTNNVVEEQLVARDLALNALKEHLVIAHNRTKKQANMHRTRVSFLGSK